MITNANLTGGVTSVGNAATVVTNANLTGGVTSVGNAATVITNANLTGGVTSVGNATTVITNANLTGDVTSVGNATTLTNAPVIAKVLTGYTSGAGTVAATDSILQAIQKLNGNDATNANLTGPITSVGNATSIASQTGTGTKFVVDTSPTIVTPHISSIVNTGTLTLPTSTDTLVGRATTDNLTNKTIPGTSLITVRLNAVETTDFANGTLLTQNVWTDFKTNQNFTVGKSTSTIMINITCSALQGQSTSGAEVSRVVLDSAGTPQTLNWGGSYSVTTTYSNPFSGGTALYITGLSAGTHTIKTQVLSQGTGNASYCRPATQSTEFYTTIVTEIGT